MLGPHTGPGDVMEIGVSPCESLRPFVLWRPSSSVWLAAAWFRNKPQDINEMAGDACTGPGWLRHVRPGVVAKVAQDVMGSARQFSGYRQACPAGAQAVSHRHVVVVVGRRAASR